MKCLDEFSVINLSDYSLNQTDLRLLSKGLTFTPTPDVANIGEIKSDLDRFLRKIRLRLYFSEEISEDEPSSSSSPTQTQVSEFEDTLIRKFRNKSNWSPKNQDAQVETYIRTVITEFQKLKLRNPPKSNLTQEEKQRLNLLQNNQHIVVKPADKGSAIVIMNRTDYITEATRQLSDTKFYTKTQVDLTDPHINKITQTLSTMLRNDEIAQSVYRNLVPKDCKTPAFYFLPKIHKQNITGRPIISGNNSPTEKISAFVDEHIKQFVPHIKSYVRDTPDFIKKIENFKLNGDYFLVTMYVTSLYTNIPNHEGLVAVTQTLIRENAQFRANNRSLITLLQHVLHMNNFQFNGENYLQIGGTAMGTRVAPSYANLFMARLEEKLLADCEYTLPLYLRYIYDIFLIFPYSEQDLTKFMTYMNNAHPTIKFTEEHSRSEIVFLDTVVKRLNENLYTDLYTKPTDTHSYLHFTSSHPKHTRHNGPYGQFLRLRRNCHFDDDFNRHADAMTQHYLKRGYPQDLITQSRHRAFAVLHHDLIHKPVTKRATNNRLPIVLTYNLTNPDIIGLVTKFWPILQTSVKGAILFKDPPVRAFRRSPNLRDHLVKAALKSNTPKTTPYPQQFCKKQDCQTCKSIKRRDKLPQNNREYKLAKDVNCQTNNVVYLLECTRCKKQYVGETKRNFLTRFKEHLADIRHNRDTPVAKHFNLNSHKTAATPAQPIPTILSRIAGHPDRTTDVRKNKEKMWIHTLRSTAPHGINVRE